VAWLGLRNWRQTDLITLILYFIGFLLHKTIGIKQRATIGRAWDFPLPLE
jgi:hypothetical protein